MKKLRRWTPPVTEALNTDVLDNILSTFFPQCDRVPELYIREPVAWEEKYDVSSVELAGIAKRLRARDNKAPGPDGIPRRVWLYALTHLSEPIKRLYTDCLKAWEFPPVWGKANLVLIPKGGRTDGAPSAYRPICLLDEVGKLFERIIADRLVRQMREVGPNLHEEQFGFSENRSTTDAILRVRHLVESETSEGRVVIAI